MVALFLSENSRATFATLTGGKEGVDRQVEAIVNDAEPEKASA
jgi:hypothetical protein